MANATGGAGGGSGAFSDITLLSVPAGTLFKVTITSVNTVRIENAALGVDITLTAGADANGIVSGIGGTATGGDNPIDGITGDTPLPNNNVGAFGAASQLAPGGDPGVISAQNGGPGFLGSGGGGCYVSNIPPNLNTGGPGGDGYLSFAWS